MKIIFLDFNGVLDTYQKMDVIDPTNLSILIDIVKETNAKIVISSSIKNTFYLLKRPSKILNYLLSVLKENNIEVYGLTPYLDNREDEIITYLNEHPEIKDYCILDDDYFFESMKEHMVKLKEQLYGGNGLKDIEKEYIIKILKK